jgi:hypothetical protein
MPVVGVGCRLSVVGPSIRHGVAATITFQRNRKELAITSPPQFTIEKARDVGSTVGVDWDVCGFSVESFQAGLTAEYERALASPDLDASDIAAGARRASAHLFDFPNYYTQQDILEAAYDEYYAERTELIVTTYVDESTAPELPTTDL